MNKNAIKKYAVWARRELIDRVSKKALRFGISAEKIVDKNVESVDGRLFTSTEKKQRAVLIKKISAQGYEQTIEEVAYTWFNRFAALRFMEVNNYLPSHIRIFTNDAGEFKPQILTEAIHLDIAGLDQEKIYNLKNSNKTEELFRYLLIVQCNALNEILPGMFERIEDYAELLLPENLLREGSVIERLVAEIPEEDWRDQVQIIGWLYQYYNTEPKDKVFADLKKNIKVAKEKISAATQLFTPDWIVRYMVENSLGRLWLDGHEKNLQADFKYYLPEAEQEISVQKNLELCKKSVQPEEILCIDPCMGSGHILCYMFDVLVKIYQDYGYSVREAVEKIVEKNLFGLDIDNRAAQLAYFSVMMKARQYDRRFFTRKIQPHIQAIQESGDWEVDAEKCPTINYLLTIFKDAKEFGSLIKVAEKNFDLAKNELEILIGENALMYSALEEKLAQLIAQAKILSQSYDVVVTNPPYMGAANMSANLSNFVKKNFPDAKSDLSTAFMEKTLSMCNDNGYMSMINIPVWMFISSYEKLRLSILKNNTYFSMLHLGRGIFGSDFGTTAFVIFKQHIENYIGNYRRLFDKQGEVDSVDEKEQKFFSGQGYYFATQENFSKIPGAPVAYWVSEKFLSCFAEGTRLGEIADSKQGLATADNDRFLRRWFEVEIAKTKFDAENHEDAKKSLMKWFPYNKGGEFRKWYGNNEYVVNWENDGEEIKNFKDERGKLRSRPQNLDYYFKESFSWSLISSSVAAFRYKPCGNIFDVAGMSCFSDKNRARVCKGIAQTSLHTICFWNILLSF